jgi:PAS domain S-box-containing protein
MDSNLRQSGIKAVGKVSWGTHFCQFFETQEDQMEAIGQYFQEGLDAHEFCLLITSKPLQVNQATDALRAAIPDLDKYIGDRQIEILDCSRWDISSGEFSADEMLRDFAEKLDFALEQGYEGLRLTVNIFRLEQDDRHDFRCCERKITDFIKQHKILAFCTYSLSKCDALELLDIIIKHQFALVKRSGQLEAILKYDSNEKITFFDGYARKSPEESLKEAQEALRQTNERLHHALSASGAGAWDWNWKTNEINWSPELFELFGLDSNIHAASFETWNQIIYPEDREIANSKIEEALKEHTGLDSDYRIILPDGKIRWINALGKGIYDEMGCPVRMIGTCIDITERKKNDERIKRQNIIFNSINQIYEIEARCETLEDLGRSCLEIIESITGSRFSFIAQVCKEDLLQVIAFTDLGGELFALYNERAHCKAPGELEIIGLFDEAVHEGKPLIRNDLVSRHENLREQKGLQALTDFMVVPFIQGAKVAGIIGAANREGGYREEDSEILGELIPTIFETIRRKQTELALEDSEEKFRLIADFTNDWENWLSPNGNYIYVSPSCKRITGYDADEFMKDQRLAIDILHPEDRSTLEHHRNAHLNELAGPGQLDYRVVTKNGETRWISHYCQPVFGKNGAWLGRRESNRDITLRKIAQDALGEAADCAERGRSQLEAVFAAQNDAILIYDVKLDVIQANPSFLNAYGFNPIGYNFRDIIRKMAIKRLDRGPFIDEQYPTHRALHGEKVAGECFRIRRADGTCVLIEISSAPVYEVDRIIGAITVWRDISEHVQAEEELRRNEETLRGILDAAKESIWLFDLEGTILMGNLIALRRLGLPAEQVIGKNFAEFMDSELAEARTEKLSQVMQSGQPIQFEDEHAGIRFHHSFYPVADRDGRVYQVAAFSSDITERKRFEENLRETRDYLENLIDHANAPIIVWDPSYRITRFNHAFERLTGLRVHEVLSKPLDILFPENSKSESMAHIKRTLSGERWDVVEIPILSKDGNVRTVLWNSANVYSKDAITVVATIAQGQDITDRKQAEMELRNSKEELNKAKEDLELKVQARTTELVRAKEAAEEAARAKSDFMANMSHEIRTPMNAIIGMTSLLIDDETLTAEQRDFIETIRTSGDALMVIINDILDFSKIERERAVLEEQLFDLHSCIDESIDLVSGRSNEKGLVLGRVIDESVPKNIIGDPNRLRQVLLNLLDNAVKFTQRGEVKLNVSSRRQNGDYEIYFEIMDSGIGISHEKMDRLFQPFSQVDTSITREYGGTGLGLAIAKKLVGLMGGRIWVDSDFGKGSTFHFTIKASSSSSDLDQNLSKISPQLVGKNVLIVDCDKTNRRILGEYAYSWGMVPLIASNSQDALNWIARGNFFNVVILDMDLPKMDESTLAGEIRKIDENIPLIMLTSQRCQKADDIFAAYLCKPIKPSQLHKILVNILSPKTVPETDQNIKIGQMHILLAEDNVSSQKVVQQMLKRLGCKVDVVANGIEALQALERQPYDLMLMDVRMPEMDGLEATRIIRQLWPDNELKVIAITAYALEGDREKCLAAGMNEYISKPVKMEELQSILKKFSKT